MARPYEEEEDVKVTSSFEDEYRYELENRVRNLLWTVSGDYELDIPINLEAFRHSRYITLYDAVKQGAFARYFDRDAFGMYLVKKLYLGAEEQPLLQLAQMCVDQAIYKKVTEERKGVASLRRNAYIDILEHDFDHLAGSSSPAARMKIAMLQQGIDQNAVVPGRLKQAMEALNAMQEMSSTDEVIRQLDTFYNELIDPKFVQEHGDLDAVMAVSSEELRKFTWQDFLDESAEEASLDDILREVNAGEFHPEEQTPEERRARAKKILITEEAARKMHDYIELHFGTSYMSELEQERMNRRLCRGIHADCKLYFTDGILANPVVENNTYVLAARTKEANCRYYRQHERVSRHNIVQLGDILKRSLQARSEEEHLSSTYGQILPAKLWKAGRTEDVRLFERQFRKNNSDFVVDVLIDSSGSQRVRQSGVALQGYILSAALSRAGIPHRVMGFCTFWDHTVLRRFREYDEGKESDWKLMEFTSSSSNRDGLALRAAAEALLGRPEENKILIVLSDGRPNDVTVNRPNVKNPSIYSGEYAVKDTASEVRRLRSQGIAVLGVFAGEEQDLTAERRIFGKDFAYIRDISTFAHVVGRYLKKQVDDRE